MEGGMDMDVGPTQRLGGFLSSKQDLCKYPTKIGGRGRMDVRIALLMDLRIIGIMSGTKADHLKDRFLRAILATSVKHSLLRAILMNKLVVGPVLGRPEPPSGKMEAINI